ncbi:MAG: DUF1365 domain-containing protein [Vicinamibacterales bacterium]
MRPPAGFRSSLLAGAVMHQRLAPWPHGFRYRVSMLRLDLDELPALDAGLRLFGVNRARPAAFHESDHLGDPSEPLRARVERFARAGGVTAPLGRIELVTQARVFGFVFNPVSFYLCHDRAGALAAIVAEVNNTFGERHCYLLPASSGRAAAPGAPGAGAGARVWQDKKVFHVSPFFTLDGTYRFQFAIAEAHLDIRIDLYRGGAPVFVSRLSLDRRPLTDRALLGLLARRPWSTVQVVAAIHWQALRLWLKGAAYHPKPAYDPESARRTEA